MAMGRGRAKAKQTKVARRLKYYTPEMDLESLQRELAGKAPGRSASDQDDGLGQDGYDDYEDPYADYFADEDEGESHAGGR